MKFFENEKIWKKLVIAILTITILQFGFSKSVKADNDSGSDSLGATLVSPVIGLFVSLGDRYNEYNTFFNNGPR